MADQPYQFGDVVDGHRWTITGWEPVEAPERTVGIPKLLEKRYAASQEAQARQQAATQTLEPEALVVTDETPVVVPDDRPVVVLDDVDEVPEDAAADEVDLREADPVAEYEPEAYVEPEPIQEPEPVAEADDAAAGDSVEEAVAPAPVVPSPAADDPDRTYSLDELLSRRVVAAPARAVEQSEDDAEPEVEAAVEPWSAETTADEAAMQRPDAGPTVDEVVVDEAVVEEAVVEELVAQEPVVDEPAVEEPVVDEPVVDAPAVEEPVADVLVAEEPPVDAVPESDWSEGELAPELPDDTVIDLTDEAAGGEPVSRPDTEPERHDARPASMRAWYGLGIEPVEEPEPAPLLGVEDDSDAPFAAALALGAQRFAQDYQPSEIEIIARSASSAALRPVDPWSALVAEPIDEWTSAPTVVPPVEQLDARALTYNATTLPAQAPAAEGRTTTTFEAPTPDPAPEPEPAPRVVTYTPAPPAGWYPGSG